MKRRAKVAAGRMRLVDHLVAATRNAPIAWVAPDETEEFVPSPNRETAGTGSLDWTEHLDAPQDILAVDFSGSSEGRLLVLELKMMRQGQARELSVSDTILSPAEIALFEYAMRGAGSFHLSAGDLPDLQWQTGPSGGRTAWAAQAVLAKDFDRAVGRLEGDLGRLILEGAVTDRLTRELDRWSREIAVYHRSFAQSSAQVATFSKAFRSLRLDPNELTVIQKTVSSARDRLRGEVGVPVTFGAARHVEYVRLQLLRAAGLHEPPVQNPGRTHTFDEESGHEAPPESGT